jgi:hypothetical protein
MSADEGRSGAMFGTPIIKRSRTADLKRGRLRGLSTTDARAGATDAGLVLAASLGRLGAREPTPAVNRQRWC